MEPGGGRRVEAVDVVELDRVEALARAHAQALVEHGLELIELPEIDPALLGVAVVHRAERGRREIPALARVRAVVLPGQVDVADRARVRQRARVPRGLDGADFRRGGEEAVDVIDAVSYTHLRAHETRHD